MSAGSRVIDWIGVAMFDMTQHEINRVIVDKHVSGQSGSTCFDTINNWVGLG